MIATTREALQLFHEGWQVLARLEANGIRIDERHLDNASQEAEAKIRTLTEEIHADPAYAIWKERYGDKTNLQSGEQLGTVLFECLKLPYNFEKTDTGGYKTEEEVLNSLALPLTENLLRIRKLNKLKSTYLTGLRREIVNGRVHPFFHLAGGGDRGMDEKGGARSFRSSSSDPNVQNQINRNPETASIIRRCFIPEKGWHWVEADFGQLEVRISACYNHDNTLINYLNDPASDMHLDTACELFLLEKHQVDRKTTRDWSKNRFVFPSFYGSVYFQCAPNLWKGVVQGHKIPGTDITIQEHLASKGITRLGDCDMQRKPVAGTFEHLVKQVEDNFWNVRFKEYSRWKKRWYNEYLKKGYFDSLTGFRMPGEYKRNDAINYPIQCAAFHCLLYSLIIVQKWLDKYKLKTRIINEVHDSMSLEVPPNELQDVLDKVHHVMTVEVPRAWQWICVPLEAEMEVAPIDQPWSAKEEWVVRDEAWQRKKGK